MKGERGLQGKRRRHNTKKVLGRTGGKDTSNSREDEREVLGPT